MKNKKGFTLIELLAVIVILAIIALIATPIILSLIEKVKVGAAKNSSYALIQSAKNYYTKTLMSDTPINENEVFTCDGSICISSEGNKLPITGTVPSSGSIAITGQGEIYFGMQYVDNEFIDDDIFFNEIMCIKNENQKINCSLEKISKKHNPGIICGNGEEEDYEGNDICYVSTVEDMNELASMVNSGKSFEGKTVSVLKSINFNNANLDVIGSASNPFAGTFEGNGYTISNIKIEGNDNTAMFGYNTGTIRGLNIENISVSGGNNTAGVVAINSGGTISMINLTGTITGTNSVSGIAASRTNANTDIIKDVIVNANITATANGSKARGIAYGAYKISGINEGGPISGVSNSFGSYEGEVSRWNINTMSIQTDPARYLNGSTMNTELPSNKFNNLNTYNEYLTTILDGADENGYYFDYNTDGTDIIVKNIKTKPINSKLSGEGTAESPYLIYNANDLRKVALETDTTGKYYSLMNDINMSGQSYFIIGTADHEFAGIFDGNGYTISNLNIEGNDYAAMFGYNKGIIRGFNIENITVTGGSGTAGLVGKNDGGIISMINLTGNITGTKDVSGISSDTVYTATTMIEDVIVNANITATDANSIASGIATKARKLHGINEGGQISGKSKSNASYNYVGAQFETATMSIQTDPARYLNGSTMNTELSFDKFNNLNAYNAYVTTILGGADENGYYFDYNDDGTDIIVKNIKIKPINSKLSGEGTAESPYLIYNANDLRKVALETDTTGKYYSLMNDINMSGQSYFIIGTANHEFAGIFDGNGYTISNLNIEGNDYAAMFGYNKGIIRGFNIENITVTGGNNVAGVVGMNNGGTISMINLTGNITGTNKVCGISANRDNHTNADVIKDVIVNANITATGANSVASGIVTSSYVLKGINEGGQISGLSNAYASYEIEASRWNIKTMSIQTDPARYLNSLIMNTELSSDKFNDLNAYNDYVTTILGGADENGYYFDYNDDGTDIIVKNIKIKPIDNNLSGLGTAESPYLIYNANDLRKVALESDTTGKYYSLMNDINMSGESYYVIGTADHEFAGIFDGNGYTISNLNIEGNNYAAMFGYNKGIIRGFNIENITVTGGNNVAGLVGINDGGTISMINLSGTITGTNTVSGISAGRNIRNNADVIKDVIVNANITATGANSVASGIASSSYVLKGINEGGHISGLSNAYASYEGEASRWNIKTMSIQTNPARYLTSRDMNAQLSSDNYNNLTSYSTYITTSADENGYYFDYNADGTDIIVKHV